MKLSISLSDAHVALIDQVKASGGFESRSAVIQHALGLLGTAAIDADYAAAWSEWEEDGDEQLWTSTAGDGVSKAATP